MSDPTDIVAALVALLEDDATVTALVGTRIFGLELPGDEAASMPRRAVVLRASGGASLTSGSTVPHDTQRIDVVCLGETPQRAWALLAVVRKSLNAVSRKVYADTLIHWANPASGATPFRDPETNWPGAFQAFQVFHAQEAIPAA